MSLLRVVPLLVVVACGAGAAAGQPPASSVTPTLLERLYSIIWPVGRFDGDLATLVSQHTQKSGGVPELPRLHLVDVESQSVSEWRSARGGLEPVFCVSHSVLLYRRGAAVVVEAVRVLADGLEASPPRRLGGIDVRHLYACVVGERGEPVAWAADAQGTVRGLRFADQPPAWFDLPAELARAADPEALGAVQVLRGIRPDGFVVSVSDRRLVAGKKDAPERSLVVRSDLAFFGYPVWVGATRFLLVNASAPVQ